MNRLTEKRLSIAPMMDWTDRACRTFHRILAPNAHLYTEMVTTGALIHGDHNRYLLSDSVQQPVILQLGGSDPDDMARSAELAAAYGYKELNINCGCPSDRVQRGAFGACLMKDAALVGDCVQAMRDASGLEVTVKSRIGVDDCEGEDFLKTFIETIHKAGCNRLIVHARKAWLKGLSPKENRDIPPLDYPLVHSMKEAFPDLLIELNGGLTDPVHDCRHLDTLDGLMIGREAYHNPWSLTLYETSIFETQSNRTREDVIAAYRPYALEMMNQTVPLRTVLKPMIGLYNGLNGARAWRRALSELPQNDTYGFEDVMEQALTHTSAHDIAA